MSNSTDRIQAAHIDGRARTPRYIQEQLGRLHKILAKNYKSICQAVKKDSGISSTEVAIEYYLSLASVKAQYGSIYLKQVLDEEYSLANERDNPSRRIAFGIAYIVPSTYTLFYSVIASSSAAIAAGNCVILEVGSHGFASI